MSHADGRGRVGLWAAALGAWFVACSAPDVPAGGGGAGGVPYVSSSMSTATTSEGGGAPCVPQPETCNGADDDCDGVVDNGDPGAGAECQTGFPGACAAGITQCSAGVVECVGGSPQDESCNGIDDDCDGEIDQGTDCTKLVFVTSTFLQGDLGGLAGADAACQSFAITAMLPGTFKAWLSTPEVDARDHLDHLGAPYVLVDGTIVADDWSVLVSSNLAHAIDLTEDGSSPPVDRYGEAQAFTGTNPQGEVEKNGLIAPLYGTCDRWTSKSYADYVQVGGPGIPDGGWTTKSVGAARCQTGASLYCFEQ